MKGPRRPPLKVLLEQTDVTWAQRRGGLVRRHIPKLREGSYFPSLLEPRRRSEKALLSVIQQAYVEGVSTRRVDDLIKALGCDGISSSQVSRICEQLDEVVESFLGRPLDGGPYPYVWLDGLTQKVREGGRIVNVCVVVATGVNADGQREILGMDVGASRAPSPLRPCSVPTRLADPTQILEWFVLRWQLEVTFHEVRTHLGVETQRQWSDLAIARTTPALLGLETQRQWSDLAFSWTTLAAHALQKRRPMTQRKAAWYDKPSPTFVDAIALARRHLWLASEGFSLSVADPDIQELPVALYHRLVDSLAYAA